MLNASLCKLTLANSVLRSPYITTAWTSKYNNIAFSQILARKSYSSFLFARAFNKIDIKDSSFQQFLSTAIKLGAKNDFINLSRSRKIYKQGFMRITFINCVFENCTEQVEKGGAIHTIQCNTTVDSCIFRSNSATFSGCAEISDAPYSSVNNTLMIDNKAERFGAMHLDGHEAENIGHIFNSNFTNNHANKWIGGVRIQHNGGKILNCNFIMNNANMYGALFDYSHKPAFREIENVRFINNTADSIGAGFTSYHLLYTGQAKQCQFFGNRNKNHMNGRSILVHSDSSILKVLDCDFDGTKDEDLLVYFATSKIEIDGSNRFNSEKIDRVI